MQTDERNVAREVENAIAEAALGEHREFTHCRRRGDLTRLIRNDNIHFQGECLFHLPRVSGCQGVPSRFSTMTGRFACSDLRRDRQMAQSRAHRAQGRQHHQHALMRRIREDRRKAVMPEGNVGDDEIVAPPQRRDQAGGGAVGMIQFSAQSLVARQHVQPLRRWLSGTFRQQRVDPVWHFQGHAEVPNQL